MKLYTELQVKEAIDIAEYRRFECDEILNRLTPIELPINAIINKLKEAYLPENVECDGAYCIGCWKDVVRETLKMLELLNQNT